jgi:hypothetical protein
MHDLTPSSARAIACWRFLNGVAVIALVATCGTISDGACPSAFAEREEETEAPGCVREPAGQSCDKATQRCESLCDPSEYLLRCTSTTLGYSATPVPGEPPTCLPVRTPVQVPADETLYCCKCEG